MRTLDIWYSHMSDTGFKDAIRAVQDASAVAAATSKKKRGKKDRDAGKAAKAEAAEIAKAAKATDKALRKARTRDSLTALPRFAELVDGHHRIASQPPVVVPVRELASTFNVTPDELRAVVEDQFRAYQATLNDDRRQLLQRFSIVDAARKVVGVGSVGTRAFMVLLQGRDEHRPPVPPGQGGHPLRPGRPPAEVPVPESRRTGGARPADAAGRARHLPRLDDGVQDNRYYYWRQLRDMKVSADVEAMRPVVLRFYARICGWTLARAHARSGDPVAIAAYLGPDNHFEHAITTFSLAYAQQNEHDHHTFLQAVKNGRINATQGV